MGELTFGSPRHTSLEVAGSDRGPSRTSGTVLNVRTNTKQKCGVVPRSARIQGSQTFVWLNTRLESYKEEEEEDHLDVLSQVERVVMPLHRLVSGLRFIGLATSL